MMTPRAPSNINEMIGYRFGYLVERAQDARSRNDFIDTSYIIWVSNWNGPVLSLQITSSDTMYNHDVGTLPLQLCHRAGAFQPGDARIHGLHRQRQDPERAAARRSAAFRYLLRRLSTPTIRADAVQDARAEPERAGQMYLPTIAVFPIIQTVLSSPCRCTPPPGRECTGRMFRLTPTSGRPAARSCTGRMNGLPAM